jgi:hypothetical protein
MDNINWSIKVRGIELDELQITLLPEWELESSKTLEIAVSKVYLLLEETKLDAASIRINKEEDGRCLSAKFDEMMIEPPTLEARFDNNSSDVY